MLTFQGPGRTLSCDFYLLILQEKKTHLDITIFLPCESDALESSAEALLCHSPAVGTAYLLLHGGKGGPVGKKDLSRRRGG